MIKLTITTVFHAAIREVLKTPLFVLLGVLALFSVVTLVTIISLQAKIIVAHTETIGMMTETIGSQNQAIENLEDATGLLMKAINLQTQAIKSLNNRVDTLEYELIHKSTIKEKLSFETHSKEVSILPPN